MKKAGKDEALVLKTRDKGFFEGQKLPAAVKLSSRSTTAEAPAQSREVEKPSRRLPANQPSLGENTRKLQ